MNLLYHNAAIELMQLDPSPNSTYESILKQRESDCGIIFPASIRELFLIKGVCEKFRHYTNEDELIDNLIMDETGKLESLGNPSECSQGYLCVAIENQAVVGWYVPLHAGDDPPVFHNDDDWGENLVEKKWRPVSDTFSQFIYDMISDGCFGQWKSGLRLEIGRVKPVPGLIEALLKKYKQGPMTRNERGDFYRFYNSSISLKILDLKNEEHTRWDFGAQTPDALVDLITFICTYQDITEDLKAISYKKDVGNNVIKTVIQNR